MKLIVVLVLLISYQASGQTKISGVVTDSKGEALPGVNVILKDSYDGGSTDVDGKFSFVTSEKGERMLQITYVGFVQIDKAIIVTEQPVDLRITLKEAINQLEAVEISAGSFTAGDEKRRTILKAVDIATTAGATADIAGALNTLPGTTKVGESGRLFVRGGDSDETRTFIDGMAVLNAYGTSAPATPSRGRFLPFMFKGTSFSTGGYSAEFGQGISSALVLNSKDKAEITQTDIGLLSVGGDVAHTQVWDRSSASAKIQYTNIRPYYGILPQRIDWVRPVVSLEGSGAYRQQIGEDGMFKFYGNFSHSDFSLNRHDIADPSIKQLYDLNNNYRYGNATYKQSLSPKWSVRGGASYNYNLNDLHIDQLPNAEKEIGTHSKVVFENSASDKIELKFGAELLNRNYSASRTDAITLQSQYLKFTETIVAGFAESEAYLSNHVVARGGLRAEYNKLNGQGGVDPRFSLAWKPAEKGQFSFAYGRFRQSVANQYIRRNTGLNSEMAQHFILNYQIIHNDRTFRVETYYKKYSSLVKFEYHGLDTLFNNHGTGYAKGFELFWRDNRSLQNVDYWISYSFLDTKRDYINYPYAAIPTFASKHNFSAVYKHFITPLHTQAGFTYSYGSSRPYNDPNSGRFNSGRTPYYQDLSANISYLPKNWLIIYASCTNLLGRNNIFGYQYSATPGADGIYASRAVMQPAKRFLFFGIFITISKNKSVNQLPNL